MDAQRQQKLAQALDHIVRVLTTQYQPDKIILFGLMAKAAVSEWSDLDLVIIKDTPLPFVQRLEQVALVCRANVGVDYLVYTPQEFDQMIAEKKPFIVNEIVRQGKVLYERQSAPTMVG
jgi:predicted nucleotidyltransferase